MASARKVGDRIVMLHEGRFITDTTPDGLVAIDDEVVSHFVEGRADAEELAKLERGRWNTRTDGEVGTRQEKSK
jgi:ABC-type transporter Mla maintaining outer membrane lipid asymmetry ATPase subunit MlaF